MLLSTTTRRVGTLAMLAVATASLTVACADDSTSPDGRGTVVVRLTDAPMDSVESVNVHVLRVDAKAQATDSADADADDDGANKGGWVTLAEPNALFDLLELRSDTATLDYATLPIGTWQSLRIVIDPSKSYIVLKDGTQLNGRTNLGSGEPGIKFPSAATSGIKVKLDEAITVDGDTTEVTIDFDAGASFVARGNSAKQQGFIFRPVIRATVED